MKDIIVQEDELEGAQWHTLEQFEANPFPQQVLICSCTRLAAVLRTLIDVCTVLGCSAALPIQQKQQ